MIKKYNEPIFEKYNEKLVQLYPDVFPNVSAILTLTFQVTEDCCMACTYCYQHQKTNNIMSFETAKTIIDNLLTSDDYYCTHNINGLIIEFIGGEPFLEVELIDKIMDYFIYQCVEKKHRFLDHFKISISSNGLLYFTEKVQKFIKKYRSFLSLTISIDGNKELHDACRKDLNGKGTYDRVLKAVLDLQKTIPDLETKMTLSPDNILFTFDAVINLINLGYMSISLNCVYEEGWTLAHAKILYQQLIKIANWIFDNDVFQKYRISLFDKTLFTPLSADYSSNWCGGIGNGMLAFDYQGNAFPCIRYMNSSLNNKQAPFSIGNINGLYLDNISKERQKLLTDITRQSQSTDECINCPVASGCGWCSAYNYECFGTPNKRATFICWMHKARALASAYYYNKGNYLAGDSERVTIYLPKTDALQIISLEEWNELKFYETKFNV